MVICETHKGFLVFLCWFVGGVGFFFFVFLTGTPACVNASVMDSVLTPYSFLTLGNHQKNQKGILEVDVKNPVFLSPYVKKGRGHQQE